MRFRTTLLLLVAVCVLGGVLALFRFQALRPGAGGGARIFPGDPGDATFFALRAGELRIECERDGSTWFIRRPVLARADPGRMQRMLAALEDLERIETITPAQREQRELELADYGLAEPGLSVVLGYGGQRHELRVGAAALLGDFVYAKFPVSHDVLAVPAGFREALVDSVESLRDRTVFPGEAFRVRRLEIHNRPGGFIQLVRQQGEWRLQQPVAARAGGATVDAMLNTLFSARVREFVWDYRRPADGADPAVDADAALASRNEAHDLTPDTAAVRIKVWAGVSGVGRELTLGQAKGQPGEGVYARLQGAPSIFTVDEALRDSFAVTARQLRDKRVFSLAAGDVGGMAILAGGNGVRLQRDPRAGWMLTAPVAAKADDRVADDLVGGLLALEVVEYPERPPTNLAAVGLSPPAVTVCLFAKATADEGGEEGAAPLTAGTADPCAGCAARLRIGSRINAEAPLHAVVQDGTPVVIAAEALDVLGARPADVLSYRDRAMLSVSPDSVQRVVLRRGGAVQLVVRAGRTGWVSGSGSNTVAGALIDEMLFRAANLRALRVAAAPATDLAAHGLNPPACELTFGLSGAEGIRKTVRFGGPAGEEGVYATVQGRDALFVVARDAATALTRNLVDAGSPPAGASGASGSAP
jgi:hypothetical protein